MFRKFLLLAPLLLPPMLLAAGPAAAQMESREGIALQNQILQLRQELDMMRRSGGGGGYAAPVPMAPPAGRGGVAGGSPELLSQMLERVGALEEEVRRLRGQVQESEYRVRTTQQALEKLQGDMDYRLQQLEQGAPAPRPPPRRARPSAARPSPPRPRRPPPRRRAPPSAPWPMARRRFPAATTAPPRPRRAR
ncbi:YbgF trimerization domain-containing protein [Teichococcus aestuarii]|uniref:YbgF trimerization domain-containing protein n=1 Tax=Teichococcus aestuarii TaxID=568898 RepID=UPI003607B0F8